MDSLSGGFSPIWNGLSMLISLTSLRVIFSPDIDSFVSRLNAKSNCFVSWHPEPGATAVDVFSIYWANLKCYAFPPFSSLTPVLAKIRSDKALVLFIASVWTTQNWYRLLLQLLTDHSILFPQKDNPLTLPERQELYPLKHSLLPSAWRLSGDHLQTKAFLARQAGSLLPHGPLGLINSTIQLWRNGVAGVNKGKS